MTAFPPIAKELGYISEDEAAELLAVTRITMQRWRYRGVGPSYVHLADKRRIAYPREELQKWLASKIVRPGEDGQAED